MIKARYLWLGSVVIGLEIAGMTAAGLGAEMHASAPPRMPALSLAQAGAPNLPPVRPGASRQERDQARKDIEKRKREAAEAKYAAFLSTKEWLLVRRAGTASIEKVFTTSSNWMSYRSIVSSSNLDLPPEADSVYEQDLSASIRSTPNSAFMVSSAVFKEYIIPGVLDLELAISEFPPKQPTFLSPQHAASLSALAPGDAPLKIDQYTNRTPYLLIRRRDDARPIERLFIQETGGDAAFLQILANGLGRAVDEANKGLQDAGLQRIQDLDGIWLGFPLKSEKVHLRAAIDIIRRQGGVGVALRPVGLAAIYPKIADLDLNAVWFPPIDMAFGLAKDHKHETAEWFSILGVIGKADEASAFSAVSKEFSPEQILHGRGVIRASRGRCDMPDWSQAAQGEDVGAFCLKVDIKEGKVDRVIHRQVHSGDMVADVLEALEKRYKGKQLSKEIRNFERGAVRVVIGYGALLAGSRADLGRVPAWSPPTVVEAVVWMANGVTSVVLQLDSAPTAVEAKEAQAPKIRL